MAKTLPDLPPDVVEAFEKVKRLRLCRDCVHAGWDNYGLKCFHQKIDPRDLASGDRPYADSTRRIGRCGYNGDLFEARPPKFSWWRRMQWRVWRWVRA